MRDGFFDALEVGPELGDLRNLDSEGHSIAGGAEADGYIGVFQGFGEGGDAAEHDALEFLFGEVGGLLAEAGQLVAEAVVLEPAVKGALSDSGSAGGSSEGGSGGDDGQSGLLAPGEAGTFRSPLIFSHFLPFGGISRRRDRVGAVGCGAFLGHSISRASVAVGFGNGLGCL